MKVGQRDERDIGRLPDLLLLVCGQIGTLQARQPILLGQDAEEPESLLA